MVHSWSVSEFKFYTPPTSRKMFEKWLLLIGCKISEVTVHSVIIGYAANTLLMEGRQKEQYHKYFHGKNVLEL